MNVQTALVGRIASTLRVIACLVVVTSGTVAAAPEAVRPTVPNVAGTTWAWGDNVGGDLGDGNTTNSSTPTATSMPLGVRFIQTSGRPLLSLSLDTKGHAWAWGENLGGLGDGSTTSSETPIPVSMPSGVLFSSVSAGGFFGLALDTRGRAWAWGDNSFGELGIGTNTGPSTCSGAPCSPKPTAVHMPSGVTFEAVSAGSAYSLALDTRGRIWAWGDNVEGQLGNGTSTPSTTPVAAAMPAGVSFTAISAGDYVGLGLDTKGRAWAWGSDNGGLGNGSTASEVPVAVTMPARVSFRAISAGTDHRLALDTDGHAWAWGDNSFGQLGVGSTTGPSSCVVGNPCSPTPVAVHMPSGVTFSTVTAGGLNSLAVDTSGRAWAWGDNSSGELGDGITTGPARCSGIPCGPSPVEVHMPTGVIFGTIAAGYGWDFGVAQSVANTGGYPYFNTPCALAPYSTWGTGFWCSGYNWGTIQNNTSNASELSKYGYDYRNCTDYIAWRLSTLGVKGAQYEGLGNAKTWAINAASHGLVANKTPAVGSVAVSTMGDLGHVAFVIAVNGAAITVAQYNYGNDGNYSTQSGTASTLGFSSFVHFEKYE